ncbi:amino acid adenylation domain-containing protein [Streptomyces sp. NPDC059479]|uniref:amino acid adenylation domain-containing protein n=1 Tax=Streptomyces sp. NPDC059479 TaxID=3346848 RepID=UPI0036B50DCA
MSMSANCFIIGGTRVLTQCAARLLDAGVRIEGILSDDPAVVVWAAEHGIPVLDPRGDLVAALSGREFDYLFSMVNFRILSREVLALPAVAAINFHDGPLPRYSGSNVPAWALFEGASRHAATWHLMDEAVDAGGVLLERWFPVRNHSTALSLTYETAETGSELFGELVPHIVARSLPDRVGTENRERRFYRRSARMASGGLIHAGTSAAEAQRIAKALDYGTFPNPLGVPALVTELGAVFTQQVRIVPRDIPGDAVRTTTTVVSVTGSALKLAAPDGDLLLSDFTAVDGSALSGQGAAQRLGITPGGPLPAVSQERLAAVAAAQRPLRTNEPWWRERLSELRPAPLSTEDFSAASAHYGRYGLAYTPKSRAERTALVRAFLAVLAERMGEETFDFAWSPSAARVRAEETHGLAAARFPVRYDGDGSRALADRLDEVTAKHGYATDLEIRLGLARRPPGSATFTRVMVLERHEDEEASVEPDTEIALLCPADGPPAIFVRETAMERDEALEFTERVEDVALGALLLGEDAVVRAADSPVPAGSSVVPDAERVPESVVQAEAGTGADPEIDLDAASASPDITVLDLIASVVAERPDAIAVHSGDHRLDYAGLDAWADAIAARLYEQGVGAGSVVGVLMARGPGLIPAMLGILRSGAAFLPLDPDYPVERLSRYTEVSRCDLVLTDARTHALGETLGLALRLPEPDGSALAVPPRVDGTDLAYTLFTSGSTGEPKGVEVEHNALANFLTGIGDRLNSSAEDIVLAHTTIAFDISLLELLLPLTVGATVRLASREVARDPHRLAELIGEVTVAQATPSMWRLLLGTGWTPHQELAVLSGGEALPPAIAERLYATARELWNLYGPTEATIWASYHRVESVGSFLPLGEPLPGLELHILDAELRPCEPNARGDLHISGAGLARGYANRPDLTADAFHTHPVTGVRLYRTGDEARRHSDGAVEWLGRADAQVKVRGNRIEPAEIERLLEAHDGVTAAVVVAVPFEGRGEPRLTAYLVVDGGALAASGPAETALASAALTKSALDETVNRALPDYMVPDAYVPVDALPLTDNGKIARSRLPLPTRDNIIRSTAEVPVARRAAPETLVDTIARVFASIVGHEVFEPGDSFFDLGGDSANVVLAATALGRELGVDMSPTSIFATGTPAKLAQLLRDEGAVAEEPDSAEGVPVPLPVPVPAPVPAQREAAPVEVPVAASGPAPVVAAEPEPRTPASVPAARADHAVAVIGMACRFPGAATPDEFWANLAAGVAGVGDAPAGHRGWGHLWADTDEVPMAWVDGVERFDAVRFGLTDREARRLDPLQRILLSVTDEALEGSGHNHTSLGANTGVFVGTIASDFPGLIAGSVGHSDPHSATGTAISMVANRLSHVFDWSGPSFAVDTACSSSLVALHQAVTHLRVGDIDAAVVGAANLVLTPDKTRAFARNGMLSPQGVCRAFDDDADGYVRGEGCGVLILKRLADAERDGDPVLAVVRGTAVNHTGASAGFLTAPSRTAQEAVIRKALAVSGVPESGIGYVEAHGTGTQLGDLIELEALQAALGGAGTGSVAVGSVKTNIGHLEPAAGIAGLIKTILALQADRIPPSLNLTVPNSTFRFEASPLYVADRLVPWSGPRVAGVSSFGFGGANAHVVVAAVPLPSATTSAAVTGATGPCLLTLSAGSDQALRTLADRLVRLLRSPYCPPLAALGVASRRRPAAPYRLACVVDSIEQLDDKLRLFLAGVDDTRSLYVGTVPEPLGTTLPPLGEKPGRDTLDRAARRFVAGESLPTEHRRAGVRFPTAPHDEKYLWLEPVDRPAPTKAETLDAVAGAGGAVATLDGRGVRTWTDHPEAVEHVVLGHPTLPGAGYPGKVAELLGRERFGLRDMTFRAAVRLPATLTAERDGTAVVFRDGTGAMVCGAELTDTERTDTEYTDAERTGPALVPPASEDGFTQVDLDAMYRAFERNGLSYGAGFRSVTWLAAAPGEALGTLNTPAVSAPSAVDDGPVDARLLDGAFQVALAACGAEGLYVPFTIGRLTVLGRLSGAVRVYARRDRDSAPDSGLLTASLVVYDGAEPVLEARGVTWKRLSPMPPTSTPRSGTAPARTRPEEPPAPVVPAMPVVPSAAPVVSATSNGHTPSASGPSGGSRGARGSLGSAALGPALAQWVAHALEIDVETLELDQPLQEQGLDSMLSVSLAQDIRSKLDVDIPVTLVLETGTVEKLAAELRDEYGVTSAPAPAQAPEAGPVETVPVPVAPLLETGGAHAEAGTVHADTAHAVTDRHDIAIVGIDGVFPSAGSPAELWRVLMDGEDCLREVPEDRWDIDAYYSTDAEPGTVYLRRAGFVDELTGFDAGFFQISPAEARWIDPQQRHLIQSAWRAMEDAGAAGRSRDRSVGVFVGASYQHYRDTVVGEVVQTAAGLGNHNAILANRVSYFLDLRGPSMTIDTLCSSSLVALHTAVRSIREGECEQAIVAGVHMAMSPQYFQLGSRLRSFSPSGASRAFDASADGFVPGEGVVTVVIKPLADALRDGDRIRGVIRGSAVNHGGRTSGLTVPSGAAQQEVISAALKDAGIGPDGIGMVEAHGTGTSLGDPIEVDGLTRAWREWTDRRQFCAIGSLKSNIGHLEPAAGLAGLVKVLLAMEHGEIPPTLHVTRPNDHIRFEDSPFYVADRPVAWPRVDGAPRRAALSAFGMGGVNAHVIVEEPPAVPAHESLAQESYVLRISGATEDAVGELATSYARHLSTSLTTDLGDFTYTANTGRSSHRYRTAVTGTNTAELVGRLTALAAGVRPIARLTNQPKTGVFMFTGQGSQYGDMGRGLFATDPLFRAALEECAELLAPHTDMPLLELLFGEAQAALDQTRYAQIGIVSVQVALVRMLEAWGIRPDMVVGHSAGELTAAWAAGVLTLPDLLRLVAVRGRLMQAQPATGTMAVVHADAETVRTALAGYPEVEIAAYNAPRSLTVSGPEAAVDAFCEQSGHRTQKLTVSHAFHSAAMEGALAPFAEAVAATPLSAPRIPFVSTRTGDWHTNATVADPTGWAQAIRRPVLFSQTLTRTEEAGAQVFWEIGPHPVLTSLGRATLPGAGLQWLHTLRRGRSDQQELHTALTSHYNQGNSEIHWDAVHHGKNQRTTTIPTYPFNRQRLAAPAAPAATPVPEPVVTPAVPASAAEVRAGGHPLFDRHYVNRSEGS